MIVAACEFVERQTYPDILGTLLMQAWAMAMAMAWEVAG